MEDEQKDDSSKDSKKDTKLRDPNLGDWALVVVVCLTSLPLISFFLRFNADGFGDAREFGIPLKAKDDYLSFSLLGFGCLAFVIGIFAEVFSKVKIIREVYIALLLLCGAGACVRLFL